MLRKPFSHVFGRAFVELCHVYVWPRGSNQKLIFGLGPHMLGKVCFEALLARPQPFKYMGGVVKIMVSFWARYMFRATLSRGPNKAPEF